MAIDVKLQVFEGPLDLLLHLIERNKVDIYDIPIVLITKQYMEYIEMMEERDMNVMSEFLVMAATLLDIKCKMLLPNDVDDEGETLDPRAELVEKLLQYKLCKYMAYELKDMHIDADKYFYKSPSYPDEVSNYKLPINYDELVGDINLNKLHEIFKSTIKRREDSINPIGINFGKIKKDEINIEEKTRKIEDYIMSNPKCSFRGLLEDMNSKIEVIVVFLIILEMIKVGSISIWQNRAFDDILIERNSEYGRDV